MAVFLHLQNLLCIFKPDAISSTGLLLVNACVLYSTEMFSEKRLSPHLFTVVLWKTPLAVQML